MRSDRGGFNDGPRNDFQVFDGFVIFRRELAENPQIGGVDYDQDHAIVHRERAFDRDHRHIQQRRQQRQHFDGVVLFEYNPAHRLAGGVPVRECRGQIDRRPTESR